MAACSRIEPEVPFVLLIDEDEIEIVSRVDLLAHFAKCRGEVGPAEEQHRPMNSCFATVSGSLYWLGTAPPARADG